MGAIFKREFKAYFTSPIGYVILAVFMFFSGLYFSYLYMYGYADISFVFSQMFTIVLFVVPIITMRTMSEDRRQKVDQALLTAPVSLTSVVMGKFLAALCVFALGFVPTFVFQLIFSMYLTPQWLIYFGNMVGILLFGGAMIAAGVFISSLTESQMVAAIGSFALSLFVLMMDTFASVINLPFVTKVAEWLSFSGRYNTFVSGVFDYANVLFFVGFAAIFLFLTVRVLDKKRWG